MRSALLFGWLIILVGMARAQEHAPTVDVCRADAAVWNASRQDDKLFAVFQLSVAELEARAVEMSKCYEVDKAVVSAGTTNFQEGVMRMVLYQSLQLLYTSEIAKRQGLFLTRHGLLKQFFEEDDKERGFLKDLKP